MMTFGPTQVIPYTCVAATSGNPADTFTYTWAFDDGTSASVQNPSKSFSTLGQHLATVTAVDQQTSGSATANVTVLIGLPDINGPLDYTFTLAMPDSQTATFHIDASYLTGTIHYEWHKIENGIDTVVGTDSATYTTGALVTVRGDSVKLLAYYYKTQFYVIVNSAFTSRRATLFVDKVGVSIVDTAVPATDSERRTTLTSVLPVGYHPDALQGVIYGSNGFRFFEIYNMHANVPPDSAINNSGGIPSTSIVYEYNAYRVPTGYPYYGDPIPSGTWGYADSARGIGLSSFITMGIMRGSSPPFSQEGPSVISETPYTITFPALPLNAYTLALGQHLTVSYTIALSRSIYDTTRIVFVPDNSLALVNRTDNNDGTFTYSVTYLGFTTTTVINPYVYVDGLPANLYHPGPITITIA